MAIDETAIHQLVERHSCRSKLTLLVRKLIRETLVHLSLKTGKNQNELMQSEET